MKAFMKCSFTVSGHCVFSRYEKESQEYLLKTSPYVFFGGSQTGLEQHVDIIKLFGELSL